MDVLLTEDEHEAVELSAELSRLMRTIIGNDPATRQDDEREMEFHIHGLQRMIMSQAAGRAFPEKYRMLGEI